MPELPDTRESLLLKVGEPANTEAWQEFAAIYRPAVYRLARRRELRDADAEDLASGCWWSFPTRSPTGGRRRRTAFRAWLATIARNAIVNVLTHAGTPDARRGRVEHTVVPRWAARP